MYKLVVVGGKLRGEEFVLENGENTLGRSEECSIPFAVNGVSKKHMAVTVTGDAAYLQDLGSSNGTFLNGKIVKRATIKNGDKIALPDSILQVVYVAEKKVVIKKRATSEEDEDDVDFITDIPPVPESLPAKIIWAFKYKVMPVFHGINEEYEWRVLFGILLALLSVVTITLTIFPVIQTSRRTLLLETAERGAHYAEEIARTNAKALETKNLDQLNTAFMNNIKDVKSYDLFDLEGRIVRPLVRMNSYIDDTHSIKVKEWAEKTKNDELSVYKKRLPDDEIGIGRKIVSYNFKTGVMEPVGVIAIRFSPKSLAVEAQESTKSYLEALMTSFLVAIIFFAIVYYLTIRPLEEMKYQIEESLRGKRRNVESRFLFSEMNGLRSSVNSILQRIRELQSEEADSEFAEMESDEGYVNSLKEFMRGAGVGVIVLNSEKSVEAVNNEAEDITGIRESSSQGMNISDVSREKGFAGTVIELCDNSANNGGTNQEGEYELQGNPYAIHVTALLGRDNFAKAFYITFVKA
ncbi:FHA domain-containing protein [Halobacteriovorax sp. HLS]|uniref:FHA domain-containing protein n=1 Tax=Halobacteriovorax sp. HLS TaxID=2234000 RepID=UPI000FD78104|nr:FHA domain-containing protein [Halobacteriovorax sp. HLS]